MGTPQAAVPSLERILADGHDVAAVYTQPDRPSGRGNRVKYSPVKQLAADRGLSVLQPVKIKTDEALETFRSHRADVVVVVAYGRILPGGFLAAFPSGAINVHFSLLPKYRGAAPVNWAIVNGETETGVTTMQMDDGLDTGAILLQRDTEIGPVETSIELLARLSLIGAVLLSESLTNLDDLEPIEQNDAMATFAPIMKRNDGLIDWRMTGSEISNRVRGFQPFPTAFTYYQQTKLTLWQAFMGDHLPPGGPGPGEIIAAHGDDLRVMCGDGSVLRIEEIQPEGKRRMPVRDFLNGFKLGSGDVLGPER